MTETFVKVVAEQCESDENDKYAALPLQEAVHADRWSSVQPCPARASVTRAAKLR